MKPTPVAGSRTSAGAITAALGVIAQFLDKF